MKKFLVFIFLICIQQTLLLPVEAVCSNLPNDMVAWWSMDSNVQDSVNNNNGTIFGGATYVTGHQNAAIGLNGTDAYITVQDNTNLNFGTGNFSISVWFQYISTGTYQFLLVKEGSAPYFPAYGITINPSGQLVGDATSCGTGSCGYGSTFHPVIGSTIISQNTWHHAVLTRNGALQQLYLDGVLDGSLTEGPWDTNSTNILSIGASIPVATAYLFAHGAIDEVRLFNRALTVEEIQALYADTACSLSIQAVVTDTLILNISNTALQIQIDPSVNNGENTSTYTSLTVATNAQNGYSLYGSLNDGNGHARLSNATTFIPAGTGENTFSFEAINGSYDANHHVDSDSIFSTLTTLLNSHSIPIGSTTTTNTQSHTIYYNLNVDYTTPAGIYTGTIIYTAVGSF